MTVWAEYYEPIDDESGFCNLDQANFISKEAVPMDKMGGLYHYVTFDKKLRYCSVVYVKKEAIDFYFGKNQKA